MEVVRKTPASVETEVVRMTPALLEGEVVRTTQVCTEKVGVTFEQEFVETV